MEYNFTVEKGNSIKDELIQRYYISRREYRRVKSKGEVYVNGELRKVTYPVKKGDQIEIHLKENTDIIPKFTELSVVYEDESLLVLNKPENMLVHPVHGERTDTLANGVLWYRNSKRENWGIHPVHRLDRQTSGLILFAKSSYIHNILGNQLVTGKIQRKYLALVDGVVQNSEGIIDFPIQGKEAITCFKVIKRYKSNTLLRLKLLTGRTHQIRIHLKALGHGIVGDTFYHQQSEIISRQALHAFKLEFIHPITLEKLSFISNLPGDFIKILSRI